MRSLRAFKTLLRHSPLPCQEVVPTCQSCIEHEQPDGLATISAASSSKSFVGSDSTSGCASPCTILIELSKSSTTEGEAAGCGSKTCAVWLATGHVTSMRLIATASPRPMWRLYGLEPYEPPLQW